MLLLWNRGVVGTIHLRPFGPVNSQFGDPLLVMARVSWCCTISSGVAGDPFASRYSLPANRYQGARVIDRWTSDEFCRGALWPRKAKSNPSATISTRASVA